MRYKLREYNINFMFTEGHNIPPPIGEKIVRKMPSAFQQQNLLSELKKYFEYI